MKKIKEQVPSDILCLVGIKKSIFTLFPCQNMNRIQKSKVTQIQIQVIQI